MENTENKSTEGETPKPKKKGFWRIFSHPSVNFISLILAIIGVYLAFHFYYAAKIAPRLVYFTHPVRATVLKAGQASEIKAFYRDKEISSDVTVAQIAIWNQGNAPIRKEQILKPVVVYTEDNSPILEATIRKTTRDVTELNLKTDDLQKGRLTLNWNILEPQDGGVIQIIYAGDSQANLIVEGVIEGQKEVEKSNFIEKIKSPDEQFAEIKNQQTNTGYSYLAPPTAVVVGCLIAGLFLLIGEKFSKKWTDTFAFLFGGVIVMILLIMAFYGIYLIFFSQPLTPPFDLSY